MTCDRVKVEDIAERYVAGRLPASDAEAFEEHFFACDACTQQILLFQAARADLTVRPLLPQPERRRHTWLRVLALGALSVLVVGISFVQRDWNALRGTASSAQAPSQPVVADRATENVPGDAHTGPERTESGTHGAPAQEKAPLPPALAVNSREGLCVDGRGNAHACPQTPGEKTAPPRNSQINVVADSSFPKTPSSPTRKHKDEDIQDPEVARKLFVLGEIEPPVYTFAGFNSASGKRKKTSGAINGQDSVTSGKGSVSADPTSKRKPADGEDLLFQEKFRQAMTAYIDGDYSKSAELLGQVAALDIGPPEGYFYLGISRMMIGRPRDAVEPLQIAARIGNGTLQSSAHLFLGKAYVQLRDLDQAESEFEKTLAAGGRNAILAKGLLRETRLLKAEVVAPFQK